MSGQRLRVPLDTTTVHYLGVSTDRRRFDLLSSASSDSMPMQFCPDLEWLKLSDKGCALYLIQYIQALMYICNSYPVYTESCEDNDLFISKSIASLAANWLMNTASGETTSITARLTRLMILEQYFHFLFGTLHIAFSHLISALVSLRRSLNRTDWLWSSGPSRLDDTRAHNPALTLALHHQHPVHDTHTRATLKHPI